MLEFRILGPVEVLRDGEPVPLSRKKQRALLALLLLHAGEVVSTDELIEELWAGRPPATARDALQNYVSQLRKALGQDVITTRDPGYALEATPEQVDIGRFELLVSEARSTEGAAARAELLREALALWRGAPLADLAFEAFTALEAARLEELRAAARGDLIDAELELSRHAELVPELETIVAERPFDERSRAQLMLALYRSGRQTDALEVYQEARQTLLSELGLDPGAELRELEQAILRQDPALQALLAAPVVSEERRKTVTVLFCDLVESTELAEALDPEILRRVLDGYFAACRRAIERHGGTVEKFIGDAVMAVFGVPRAHEDDALRALRAAVETRDAVSALSDQLQTEQDLRLDLRIGINTGEVYVASGEGASLVTGNAVNLAKRLEQAAPAGSIMLGAGSLELVRDAVRVQAVGPREELSLPAFRLLELVEGAPAIARYFEAPLVGRDAELAMLLASFEQARSEQHCRLVTVVGEPGIGKTRLGREVIASLQDEATVLVGRCIAYGEGATFMPLRDMLDGIEGDLTETVAGEQAELVAQRVTQLIGHAEGTSSIEEGLWAVRLVFEGLALQRPLLLVFEDVHWAEPTLLDLVEQLAERASGPILVLCASRPELFEMRPSWRETSVELGPLPEQQIQALVAGLPGGADVPPDLGRRLVTIAGGNPLFAEELVAHAQERGAETLEDVPPSIEALLASRLDLLQPEERSLLERAAVLGAEFSREGLVALAPDALPNLSVDVLGLVRKGLVRPATAAGSGELFRFHHVLVRDVAYASLPVVRRAELHERFADWLEAQPDAPDEMVGYHLEQAVRNREALALLDGHTERLANRSVTHLMAARARAFGRGDLRANARLLERAVDLLPRTSPERLELLPELARSYPNLGEYARAAIVTTEAIQAARDAGDSRQEMHALVVYGMGRLADWAGPTDQDIDPDPIAIAHRAIPVFEEHADELGLAKAWRLIANVHLMHGQTAAGMEAAKRQINHAQQTAGGFERPMLNDLAFAAVDGMTPVPDAIELCEALLQQTEGNRRTEAGVLEARAQLQAMAGSFAEARESVAKARRISEEISTFPPWIDSAAVELLDGNAVSAELELRDAYEWLRDNPDLLFSGFVSWLLGEALYRQGRFEEAERFVKTSPDTAGLDIAGDVMHRAVAAKLLARRGAFDAAEELASEALTMAEPTELLCLRGDALMDLADVESLAGRPVDAATTAEKALELYERKGNVVSARKARTLLNELRETASA